MIGGVDTQGSVLRPQPWAEESQLLQSCCCLWPSHVWAPFSTFLKGKEFYLNAFARGGLVNCPFCERVKYQLRVTPAANRNSYRVAMISLVDTQGSVLRPQPWAGETQLLQSCRCLWPSHARALFSTFLKGKEFSTPPIQTLPKGNGHYPNALARVGLVFSPLGES